MFIKKCWAIIKDDFYDLIRDLEDDVLDLRVLNISFITLIPKKNNSVSTNDFRSISLLNTALKLITKLLANRLQTRITNLVHKNQYGFIKGRAIQDCLG